MGSPLMMYFEPRGLLRRVICAGAVALLADHEQQAEIAHALFEQALGGVIMEAMMPLVSQAPRPQMNSSSSREGTKGGTVSMWVESVTTGSPKAAKTLKRCGSTSIFSTLPLWAAARRRQIVEQILPDSFFFRSDGRDIDQRSRQFEYVHIASVSPP